MLYVYNLERVYRFDLNDKRLYCTAVLHKYIILLW